MSFNHFFLQHGYWFLFIYLLAVGFGLPLPADPVVLLMGAQIGNHKYSFLPTLCIAISAMLAGDSFWYVLGRTRGHAVLGFICKLSLEPDNCVRKAEVNFAGRGIATLLFAKFIPGLGLLSVSLAGVSRLRYWRLLIVDAAGGALWASSYLLLGRIFYRQMDRLMLWLGLFGRRAGLILTLLIVLYIAAKYIQRKLFLRKLRVNRISPRELLDLLNDDAQVAIVDLRHPAEIEREGLKIAGALILRPSEIPERIREIAQYDYVVLYCT